MGVNNFVADTTVRAQLYAESVWRRKLPDCFWSRFMNFPMPGQAGFQKDQYIIDQKSNSIVGYKNQENSIFYVVRELAKGFGDKITFPHTKALSGEGITGTSGLTLEGNEESMDVSNFSLELEEYAHAVADKSPLGRKRTQFDLIKEMGSQIMSWGATKTDKLIWDALYSGTATTILYPGTKTSTTTIEDDPADRTTMSLLRKAQAIAKTSNVGTRDIVEPIIVNGKEFYLIVMPEDALLDLKEDGEFKNAIQYSYSRGDFLSNPIFAGADYITVDGLVIYSHERAKTATNWGAGANVAGARIKLLGKNSLCYAMGPAPSLVGMDTDYGRKKGISFQMLCKTARPIFGSVDYGSMEIRVNVNRVTF